MKEQLEYLALKSLLKAGRRLPARKLYKNFERLALLLYWGDSKRRKLTQENLKRAGFDPSLAKEVYLEMGKTSAEIVMLYQKRFSFAKIMGEPTFSTNKPKIFITAHFGNWEALAHYLALKGHKMAVVAREGNNKLIDSKLVYPFRKMYGNEQIYKEGAIKEIVKMLKEGKNVGLLIDQKAGKAGIKTTFFNRECKTIPTVAMLAKRFDVEIVPIFLAREGRGFRLIQKKFNCDGCDEVTFTQKLNDILEEVVREYPTQWFWMHNRWK
ncbi:MAG: lysophospholipid acyltransferase family protein [Epsilonproteobacteria bacterium]|nr:lysophospholipid acyltransferase family protein [Campylobacterota bacterium]